MKPITLLAPKISAAERKELTAHKSQLEEAIAGIEAHAKKVEKLLAKKSDFEKETPSLQRAAQSFHPGAELALLSNQQGIIRVVEAILEAEGQSADDSIPLWNCMDQAQENIHRICQASYNALLDQIGTALTPYHRSFEDARYVARGTPAVNDLVINLLTHRASPSDSIERLFQAAVDTLRKVEALLSGSEIWSYGEDPANDRRQAAA